MHDVAKSAATRQSIVGGHEGLRKNGHRNQPTVFGTSAQAQAVLPRRGRIAGACMTSPSLH